MSDTRYLLCHLQFSGGPKDGSEATWCIREGDELDWPEEMSFTVTQDDAGGDPYRATMYLYAFASHDQRDDEDGEPIDVVTFVYRGIASTITRNE